MTWRVPPFDRAADEAEAYVRATWHHRGIVIAGSIVRGEAGPTSDLDIVVVHAEPWRVRDQKRFAGVPAELFVNPPERIRGYFSSEHAAGRPCTAHMLATGSVLAGAEPIVGELVAEAREWLAKPFELSAAELTRRRYGVVDLLDDARDAMPVDRASGQLLLASAVEQTIAYAFAARGRFQPRRKTLARSLAALDPIAAELLQRFTARDDGALAAAVALAQHVLGVDTFFEWTSERTP